MTTDLVVGNIDQQLAQAETYVKSGLLPPSVNTPEKALVIIQKGRELNIPPMEALSSINVIQGKPSVSPQLMLALARRTGQLEDIQMVNNKEGSTVTVTRHGQSPYTTTFGIKEATEMGLINKDNYKKQFGVMCQWRALAANLRITFPDAISGLYTFDEMGVGMDEEGRPQYRPSIQMPKAIEKKLDESIDAEIETDKELI